MSNKKVKNMLGKKGFDLNQGIKGGKYSILKIFHHSEKLNSFLAGKITSPLYVRIKPTNTCCHNCFYCVYNPWFSSIHPESNRSDMIPREKLLEVLRDLKDMNVKAVTFSGGGEPLTYPHIVEALKKTLDYRINLSMITNAQLLKGEAAELLGQGDWIRVSLDYCDEDTFSKIRGKPGELFNEVKENLKKFAEIKNSSCDFEVNCVVGEHNFDKVLDIAKFCQKIGVDNLRFAPVWKQNFEKYHEPFKEKAVEQIKKAEELQDDSFSVGSTYDRYFEKTTGQSSRAYKRCFYMECVPVIAANQGFYPCHNCAYEPMAKIGSIQNKSFKELWFSQETAEFLKNFNPQKICTHECSNDEKNKILNEWMACRDDKISNFI